MSSFYCLLGNTPILSLQELTAILGADRVTQVSHQIAEVQLENEAAAVELMAVTGGLVKITRPLSALVASDPASVEVAVANYLTSLQLPKVTFAVAEINRDHQEPVTLAHIKKMLTDQGIGVRYVEAPRSGLSASVLLHQKEVVELVILPIDSEWWLTQTVAVQNIDEWTDRDRSKPYADRQKGMLPPKVARMMVNLALSHLSLPNSASKPLVYDPFCGTGTVLMEAMVRGCRVVGSDLDAKAVEGTRKNLAWLIEETGLKLDARVFTSDVSRVDPAQIGEQIDCIVTEPFLGKMTPHSEQLPGIFKGLGKLYLGAFKRWRQLVKSGSVIVIVFPYVEQGNRIFSLEDLIDKLAPLGYTIISEPVLYHRPQAVVQRQIHIFRYQA